MTHRQLGIFFKMMETWQPANLIRDVPEEEYRTLSAYYGRRSLTEKERWSLPTILQIKDRSGAAHHREGKAGLWRQRQAGFF